MSTNATLIERLKTNSLLRKSRGRIRGALLNPDSAFGRLALDPLAILLGEVVKEGLLVMAPDTSVLYANSTFCRMLGYSLDEIAARPVRALMDATSQLHLLNLCEQFQRSENPHFDFNWITKHGTELRSCVFPIAIDQGRKSDSRIAFLLIDLPAELSRSEPDCRPDGSEQNPELRQIHLMAQEEERKRISNDLHDSVCQYLTAIKLKIEGLMDHSQSGVVTRNFLEEISSMTRAAIRELRQCIMALRPPVLDDLGLEAAIVGLIREYQSLFGEAEIKSRISLGADVAPNQVDIVIYRIIQEALNNVGKHAKATRVFVDLGAKGQSLRLSIEDNGRGFSLEEIHCGTRFSKGLGIYGMKERAELSGGQFSISSKPGIGTSIQVVWSKI